MTRLIYAAVCQLWECLARMRAWSFRAGLRPSRRLRAPVVSVGNLTFGGTGKTPFTIWLASRLCARGYRLSILLRGYKRKSSGVRLYLPGNDAGGPGETVSAQDGDEAQLYRRHLPQAALGIARRRYDAGAALEASTPLDVHLLDDGFQHLYLSRACDIVLIDASNPWGRRPGFPRSLREPVSALRRADILLLTRCQQVEPSRLAALEAELRGLHPGAAIFRASTTLASFNTSGPAQPLAREALAGKRAVAFCGIGHPENFLQMLKSAGVSIVATRSFPDHHHYNDQDVDQLNDLLRSHGADCLITTEKDVVNLPHPARFADNFIAPAYWAGIGLAIQSEDDLLRRITEKIGPAIGDSGRN
jgi:tetraacyldisaccharide 4'-kinase